MELSLTVNGVRQSTDVDPSTPLLWVLREQLGLTGTKFGCGIAQCGACSVLIDGVAVRACVTPVRSLEGREIVTIEGLAPGDDALHPLQEAWIEHQAPQCGYCQSGQLISAAALLQRKADPTDAEINSAMEGNICRCGMYGRIRNAIKSAARKMRPDAPDAASSTEADIGEADIGEADNG